MGLQWLAGELRTGRVTTVLPLTGSQWSMVLDDAGQLSGTLTLADPDVRALQPFAAAEPGRTFLAAVWVDDAGEQTILEAGPVWTHNYKASDRTLRIGAAGVLSYYDHRKVMPVLTTVGGASEATYETGPTSLGTIAKRLVALAHTHTHGSLPIVLPADVAGDETRTYPGSELAWVGQKLRDLVQEDGGPEIQFVPRFQAGDERAIEWVMLVGTPTQPLLVQAGADWIWDYSTDHSTVADIDVQVDGTALASRAWAAGAASGDDRLIEYRDDTTLTTGGWPLLETEAEGTDTIGSRRQLASVARQAVTAARLPVYSLGLQVDAGAHPSPGMFRPGHWGEVILGGRHDYIGGSLRGRVTQVQGNDSTTLSIQFQPEPGAIPQPVAVTEPAPTPTVPEIPDPETPVPVPPVEPEEGDDPITWSSGAFLNHLASSVAPFGTYRDRPLANVSLFPSHEDLSELQNTWYLGSTYLPSGWSGDVSLAMPMCDDTHDVTQNISTQLASVAADLADYTSVRKWFIRLGWEMNLPQWPWHVDDANLTTWRSRFSTYADIFTSALGAKAVIVFNPNIGPPQSGLSTSIDAAFVDGKVHAAGPDIYDCWEPFTTSANINAHLNGDQELNWWVDLCQEKGVGLCIPEWGVSSGTQWAGHCGGDNPIYITTMVDFFTENADLMAFESYFNENASYLESDLWNPGGGSNNPLASAAYATRYATP